MPRTIVHFPEILLPDPKDMGPVQPVTQLEQKREYGSIRPVMIVRFGFKSNGQTTFHHCILIGDTQKIVNGERDIDNGKLFDWGSMPDTATSNKFKEPCRVKAFDLSLAHSSRNEYDHRGYTARSDKEIEELSTLLADTTTATKLLLAG